MTGRSPADTLTPTEELFLAVLAARTRLGEPFWTFGNQHRRTANRLESKGLVTVNNSNVEASFRAELTAAGREEAIDPNYTPPAARPANLDGSVVGILVRPDGPMARAAGDRVVYGDFTVHPR